MQSSARESSGAPVDLRPATRAAELAWALRLVEATTPRAIARHTEALARVLTEAEHAALLWLDGEHLVSGTDTESLDVADLDHAAEFLASPRYVQTRGGAVLLRVA